MEEDQFDDDIQDNQRSIVIGAVLLAVLVAAVLWYAVIFRNEQPGGEELAQTEPVTQVIELPAGDFPEMTSEEEIAVDSANPPVADDSAVAGTSNGVGHPVKESPQPTYVPTPTPEVMGVTGTSPAPAPVTSPTGASTLLAAAAAAAGLGGLFGLKRISSK